MTDSRDPPAAIMLGDVAELTQALRLIAIKRGAGEVGVVAGRAREMIIELARTIARLTDPPAGGDAPTRAEACAMASVLRGDMAYDDPAPEIAADMLESQAATIAALQREKREAEDAALELLLVVEDFMPNIGRCAIQNYARLNTAQIAGNAIKRRRADEEPKACF